MVSVVFRSVLQFALVWLVAATHELVASRTALAAAAAERERARLEADVRGALERRANAIRRTAREARAALAGPGQAAVLISLDRVLALSREALADVREVVAGARRNPPASAAADELARGSRLARAPVRAATRNAWLPTAAVLVIVLGYPLTLVLGAWTLAEPEWGALASIGGWALAVVPYALVAVPVAQGRPIRFGPALLVASAAISTALVVAGNDLWGCIRGWAPPRARSSSETAGRRTTCSRRWLAVAVFQAVRYSDELLLLGPSFIGWFVLYTTVLGTLASTALVASVRFVAVVAELDRTRDALAHEAANAERLRLSSDVHDVLGHSLTAISLKADLARRVLADDRDAAARELDELLLIADEGWRRGLHRRPRGRLRGRGASRDRAAALGRDHGRGAARAGRARRRDQHRARLRGARGVDEHPPPRARPARLDRRLERGRPGARGDRQRRRDAPPTVEPGTGLAGIAERAAARGGFAETDALPGGRFRLRVDVPAAGARMIRVLLAEDQAMIRGALLALIGLEQRHDRRRRRRARRRGRRRGPQDAAGRRGARHRHARHRRPVRRRGCCATSCPRRAS